MSHMTQYSPHLRKAEKSPNKLSNSVNLSERIRGKTETSPRKVSQYTVHHDNKLKVFVKFRPPTVANNRNINVAYLNEKEVEIERQSVNNKIYTFDRVYNHSVSSECVFETGCKDVIDDCIRNNTEGSGKKNGLIFVYGHTGTGKTYTMGLLDTLNRKSQGIVPESLKYIFSQTNIARVSLSFTEVYMDDIYDMLDFENEKKLTIRQNKDSKEPYAQNQIMISINNIEEAYQLINIGLEKRRVAEQRINKRSSRGHGILTLNITTVHGRESRICFVDLAGSQRVKESESAGKILTEAVHINTSLSALETLLMNISQQSVRIYRGNKLTRLLQPFFESGKIRLFVTSNYENIQPIEFAKRCKGIRFMEREVVEPKMIGAGSGPQNKKNNEKVESLEKMNKNLLYCVSNMLGLFNKISQMMSNSLEDQNVQSNFSLSENFSIKNDQIENRVNEKIRKLEVMEEQIIDREMPSSIGCVSALSTSGIGDNLSDISAISASQFLKNPNQLIATIKDSPNQFMKKLHEVGFNIFQSIKQLSNLSEYRNIYKKEIFSSELKACLLENKNIQFEKAINHLLKSFQKQVQMNGSQTQISKVIKELNEIGVSIGGNSQKKNQIKLQNVKKHSNPQVNAENSMSSSKLKADIIGKQRNQDKTPKKSSQEEFNEFLPFEEQYEYNQEDVQLFKSENANYANQEPSKPPPRPSKAAMKGAAQITGMKNAIRKGKQHISPVKKSIDPGQGLKQVQRRSLILIQDL